MESERGRRHHCPVAADSAGWPGFSSPVSFIEHRVSKLDTLAGVAIKYGVEVGDIKRMNGLVTDLQMFALKTLRIPLPGRHPPSPVLSNGAASPGERNGHMESCHPHLDDFESFLPLKSKSRQRGSTAMRSLQGYYSLTSLDDRGEAEGTEMSVYGAGIARNLDKGHLAKLYPVSESLPFGRHKAKSFINGFLTENGELIEHLLLPEIGNGKAEICGDVAVGRHQKAEIEPSSPPPELILMEDNVCGGSSGRAGKNLGLRPKSINRAALPTDAGTGLSNQNSVPMGDLISTSDGLDAVRKSFSTSSLQSEAASSIWPRSKWTLKHDLQSLTAVAITRPIFDGLPNSITGRRSKAALD